MRTNLSTQCDSTSELNLNVKQAIGLGMGFVLFIMWILQLLIADTALAQVRVSRLVLENMVLQRGVEIKIWGWADPAEQITTEFCNQTLQWNLASPIP